MDLTEGLHTAYRHPWETARSKSILAIIQQYAKDSSVIADIGAGDMFFAAHLRQITQNTIYAIDTGYPKSAEKRNGIIKLNSIANLPNNSIDILIMMDVLEHIEDETEFLCQVTKKLRENCFILCTAPAFNFLYTSHDRRLKHYRRYRKACLKNILIANGITVERIFYFYTTLFLIRSIQAFQENFRQKSPSISSIGNWAYHETSFFSRIITALLQIDFSVNKRLNQMGIDCAGLSLLCIGKFHRVSAKE